MGQVTSKDNIVGGEENVASGLKISRPDTFQLVAVLPIPAF
jgi:hypothetical protein